MTIYKTKTAKHFLLLLVFSILSGAVVLADNKKPIGNGLNFKTINEVNTGIANQLEYLIDYNKEKAIDNNWFVYVVGDDTFNVELLSEYVEDDLDLSNIGINNIPVKVEVLNAKLIELNEKLSEQKKPLIYYGVSNKKTAIPAPFFPFEDLLDKSTGTVTEILAYYNRVLTDDSSEKSSNTAQLLKQFYDNEVDESIRALMQKTLSKAGDSGAVALSKYYYAFIKQGGKTTSSKAKISWWSRSKYEVSSVYFKDHPVNKVSLNSHFKSLSGTTKKNNIRNVNAWFNYLTGSKVLESGSTKEVFESLLSNSECKNLSSDDGEAKKAEFIAAVSSGDIEKIIKATTSTCSSVIKKAGYNHIITAIKKIATEKIKEKGEVVVLFLMYNIDNTDYASFLKDLKAEDNSLLDTLLVEMDDTSLNPYDGENYSSFINQLLYIGYQNDGEYLKKERAYLLDVLLASKESFDWSKASIEKAIVKVSTFYLRSEETSFYDHLEKDNYKKLLTVLLEVSSNELAVKEQEQLANGWSSFFADSNKEEVYLELLDIVFYNKDIKNTGVFFTPETLYRLSAFVAELFNEVPSTTTNLGEYLANNDLSNLKEILVALDKREGFYGKDTKVVYEKFFKGVLQILDRKGDASHRIALAKWAITTENELLNFKNIQENLVLNIFKGLQKRQDKLQVYNFLSFKNGNPANTEYKNHEYFNKIVGEGSVLSGHSSQRQFIQDYVNLILEGFGDVQDRISIIQHAVKQGDDWSFFWFSDTEDVISSMFNDLRGGDAEEFIDELKKRNNDGNTLFAQIWEILQSNNWWASVDRDNERFANFVINLSKVLKLSNEELGYQEEQYRDFLDVNKKYLTTDSPEKIPKITTNFIPMARANFFDQTDGNNSYDLDSEVNLKTSKVKISLAISGNQVMGKSFDPFEYVFVEFVEDTKINNAVRFSKGDIIGVPAFYIAWMDGSIGATQNSVVGRVTLDGIVIVASAIAIYGSGGALTPAVMAASAEIFFASTDIAIAIYKDELDNTFGTDFVNTLEIANMIWGLANLPVALKELPNGLLKIKKRASKTWISLKKGATFKAGEISKLQVNTQKFIVALPKILKKLKNNPAVKAEMFKKLSNLESNLRVKIKGLGNNASSKLIAIHKNTSDILSQFYYAKAPLASKIVSKFPEKVQSRVVNKLLTFKLEGKTLFKIDPEGFLQNIDIYSKAENYKPIPRLEEPIFVKVKVKGKVYEEYVVIVKDYKESPIFRPKYENGVTRSSDLINELHIRSSNSPPYMDATDVTDYTIPKGDNFYVVEYVKNQDFPGGFGSNVPIKSIEELREKLAVIESWKDPTKNGGIVLREYEALQPIKTRSGFIGPQTEITGVNAGQIYNGGGHQYEFLNNWRAEGDLKPFMKKVKETKLLANTVAKHPNWVEITNITSKVDGLTPHVLKVETKVDGSFFPKNKNINGQSFQMEGFKGCHSENALKEYVQANGGTYSVKNKSIGQGGVYEGQPVINLNNKEYVKINGRFVEYQPGKLGGTSSFFPENWTNAKIKQEVEFALTNNHGKVNVNNPNDNLHFGFSSDGNVEIQFKYRRFYRFLFP